MQMNQFSADDMVDWLIVVVENAIPFYPLEPFYPFINVERFFVQF